MSESRAKNRAEKLILAAAESGATELNLSPTSRSSELLLTKLPDSLRGLSRLQSLNLYNNRLEELPDWIGELGLLRTLQLSSNRLTQLPGSLKDLPSLQTLELAGNKFNEVPDWIGDISTLLSLDLSSNRLTEITNNLRRLTRLHSLQLSNNKLSSLPEALKGLSELRLLQLASNQFVALPDSVCQLGNLEMLNISSNQLRTLPPTIGNLKKLRTLSAYRNELQVLPDALCRLTGLENLNLGHNPLQKLPSEIGALSKLKSLTVGATELKMLPESARHLSALRFLVVSHTPIERLPEWIGELRDLEGLNAAQDESLVFTWDSNQRTWASRWKPTLRPGLSRLPRSMINLTNLKELYLHSNPGLDIPSEVLGPNWNDVNQFARRAITARSPRQILQYYFRGLEGTRPLNEAKLILIGRGGVGKTSVIKRLVHGTFDEKEPETPGIEIQPWSLDLPDGDSVRLHVWDFGGQEILHATHQFFLTERTLYVLVLSGREGTATQDAEYWLQLIRSFGGDSPVIVVLNKSQQHPFDVNRGLLLEKYLQITAFVRTDCLNMEDGLSTGLDTGGLGIQELRDLIIGAAASLEHRKVDFPTDWFEIKERLAAMTENFLTWDQYQAICRQFGEGDSGAQRDLAGYLHILGIALNYRDDPRLRDTHVLNPRWVTEGIYAILRIGQKEKHEREGVLEVGDLSRALDATAYPAPSHEFLLALMEKFQLCFLLPGTSKRYLVPELLGENQPDEIKSLLAQPGLGFRFQYEVLPQGLLPRFIVQTHIHSAPNPKWRWRTGVVLSRSGSRAIIRADIRERRVDIHISGAARQRRDLLAIIRDRFDEQHRELKGLVVDQRVPIPDEAGVTCSYDFLVRLEAEGELWYRPEGTRKKYYVAELLNGIESPERRANRRGGRNSETIDTTMGKAHVFLSYCHDNTTEVQQLRDDLIVAGEPIWWDEDILPGSDWKLAIDIAMRDSYAVILCFSKETEARTTTGIYPEAANAIAALREYAPGSIFLIPVRLSPCVIPPFEIDATRRLDRLQYIDLFPPAKRTANISKLVTAIKASPSHP